LLRLRPDVADKIKLEANEIKLAETNAAYQSPMNNGTLILTNRRLIWRIGWMISPLGLFGQREVIIPIEGIEKCYSRGSSMVLGTQTGDFYFFIRNAWSLWWDNKKVRVWVARIEELMIQRLEKGSPARGER
jgi:hypothetical protein